ncbi:hypothetical protein [Rhodospirillum sp. A1_3_36]|uniref:hypothetical protein n=1 Tax=Rhodospirillum sp. A1_3_36 TaxID=3391666 RepID=UPI0039A70C12
MSYVKKSDAGADDFRQAGVPLRFMFWLVLPMAIFILGAMLYMTWRMGDFVHG